MRRVDWHRVAPGRAPAIRRAVAMTAAKEEHATQRPWSSVSIQPTVYSYRLAVGVEFEIAVDAAVRGPPNRRISCSIPGPDTLESGSVSSIRPPGSKPATVVAKWIAWRHNEAASNGRCGRVNESTKAPKVHRQRDDSAMNVVGNRTTLP